MKRCERCNFLRLSCFEWFVYKFCYFNMNEKEKYSTFGFVFNNNNNNRSGLVRLDWRQKTVVLDGKTGCSVADEREAQLRRQPQLVATNMARAGARHPKEIHMEALLGRPGQQALTVVVLQAPGARHKLLAACGRLAALATSATAT